MASIKWFLIHTPELQVSESGNGQTTGIAADLNELKREFDCDYHKIDLDELFTLLETDPRMVSFPAALHYVLIINRKL